MENSGQTADMKAICLPSRDQVPIEAPVAILVSCRAPPPAVSMIHSWLVPERDDSKRIDFESGLQRGCRSLLAALVSCFGSPPFSVDTSHRCDTDLFAFRSTSPCT